MAMAIGLIRHRLAIEQGMFDRQGGTASTILGSLSVVKSAPYRLHKVTRPAFLRASSR
jgi:hypothetical protein